MSGSAAAISWLTYFEAAGGFAAAVGLFFAFWQLRRGRQANDLLALQRFFEDVSEREAALFRARTDHDAWRFALYDLVNLLEVYAGAYNHNLIVGRHLRETIRYKIVDAFIEISTRNEVAPLIEADRSTTFVELRRLVGRYRAEYEKRRAEQQALTQ